MKNDYIQATLELLNAGKDLQAVLNGLKNNMEQKGHMRLYASVLRGIVRILETQKATKTAVYVAKEADIEALNVEIDDAIKTLGATDAPETIVDPTIIGGVVVKDGNTVLDRSYKTALTNLYRAITK
tara:strand:+ start:5038 stop:5418 length:381 start_codon:yes stop_codon:yes gene_type:complete